MSHTRSKRRQAARDEQGARDEQAAREQVEEARDAAIYEARRLKDKAWELRMWIGTLVVLLIIVACASCQGSVSADDGALPCDPGVGCTSP